MNNFSFSEWLSSKKSVSFALAVGVVFLIGCYSKVVSQIQPDGAEFAYPWIVSVLLAHVDAFFFGLATAIILYQTDSKAVKITFVSFEAVMIFLYSNIALLSKMGFPPTLFLGTFTGIFGALALYHLGILSKQHRDNGDAWEFNRDQPEADQNEEKRALSENVKRTDYLKKYAKVVSDLREGVSVRKASKKHALSTATVNRVKLAMSGNL